MTELDLYNFIEKNNVEYHWEDNNGYQDVMIFPFIRDIQEFYDLLSDNIFDDEGIECIMKDNYFAIYVGDICEYYDIDMEKVFTHTSNR